MLIEIKTTDDLNELDTRLKKHSHLFHVYSLQKFKEILQEESTKKNNDKNNKNNTHK